MLNDKDPASLFIKLRSFWLQYCIRESKPHDLVSWLVALFMISCCSASQDESRTYAQYQCHEQNGLKYSSSQICYILVGTEFKQTSAQRWTALTKRINLAKTKLSSPCPRQKLHPATMDNTTPEDWHPWFQVGESLVCGGVASFKWECIRQVTSPHA